MICESIGRLARNSAVAFTLEGQFRAAGASLHCADDPSHPAIISRAEYKQVQAKAAHNQRSRRAAHFQATPLHKSDYVFRSIKCAHCDLRM